MEELINKNNQIIKEVIETLPNIQQSIDDVNKNYQYYLGSIKNEVFKIKPDEIYSEAIKRGEGIFDRIDETERRRKLVIEKSQETINQIEIMKKQMSRIIEECNHDEETLSKTRNELIDKIISIEEMIMKDKIFRETEETDTITTEFNKKKEEWEKQYSDYLERKRRQEEERRKEERRQQQQQEERRRQEEEERRQEEEEQERKRQEEEEERKKQEQERKIQEHERKIQEQERKTQQLENKTQEQEKKIQEQERKIQQLEKLRIIKEERKEEERLQRMRGMSTMEEMLQIEEWTEKRIYNILFDSDKDDWNRNTSVFGERVMNKEHIIIIIEDEDGNKFGGYVNSKIGTGEWIYDSKSFVFSLETKERMKGMKKFDIKQPQDAFCLYNQSHDILFMFGLGDIRVYKENDKTQSYCSQFSFEYEGISNALCGKQYSNRFTPKRIIVIEMK
ncbi:TLD, putative [Entamoeba histolytica]